MSESRHDLLRARLAAARLYLCTDSRAGRGGLTALAEIVEGALSGGVDIVQLRDKSIEAMAELAALEVIADACRRHGALLAVNDRADIAATVGADVLHLGQQDLPVPMARTIVGADMIIGRSSSSPDLAAAAAVQSGVDYFCIGPCWTTPTKPGRPAAGLDVVAAVATAGHQRPWFAIGGIDAGNLDQVLATGATRIVVVRAITEADDPMAAARALADRLHPVAAR